MARPPPQLSFTTGVMKIIGPVFIEQLMGKSSNVYSSPTVVLIPKWRLEVS